MNIIEKGLQQAYNFVRGSAGDTFYYTAGQGNAQWNDLNDKINVATKNPILMPGIQLIADYFSSAKFFDGEVEEEGTPILDLLQKPNPYQTRDDFLKQLIWYKYSCGFDYMHPISVGNDINNISRVKMLYNLKPNLIEFDEHFKTKILITKADVIKTLSQKFLYDKTEQNLQIPIGNVLPLYDLANGLDNNMFTAPSRIDALKMPLTNVTKAFAAKNIVIDSNGKDMITNKTVGSLAKVPIKKGEKEDIDRKMSVDYGLGAGKKRTIITNSALEWQSLHIKLKELGLDESVIADAMIIIGALGIPPELFSVNGSSSTFENQSKAVIHFVQSKIQTELNDFCKTINLRYGTKLTASMNHLPMMRENEKSKVASARNIMAGIKMFVDVGIMTPTQGLAEYEMWKEKM